MIDSELDTSTLIVVGFGITGLMICIAFAVVIWVAEPLMETRVHDLEARIIELEGKE